MLSVEDWDAVLPGLSGDFDDSGASSNVCATCCSSCSIKRHEFLFSQASSFSPFENLLHAGSLSLRLLSDGSLCTHQHAEDGFHTLQDVHFLHQYLASEELELLDAISFLLRNSFVLVTYMLAPSTMGIILRVYLIPHDLPGAKGTLRTRSEDKVMKPARSHLRKVLSRVSRNRVSWNAEDELYDHPSLEESFLPPNQDQRSLSRIFNDLTSMKDGKVLPSIPKLRATLYEYQEESVARMLAMESQNRIADDPLYIPITGMNDRVFYFQPTTMELVLHLPRSYQSRGGVLCEELGTGKTVMTLALILATLDVLPDPPEQDDTEILTPLALRCFPKSSLGALPIPTIWSNENLGASERNRTVPSLVEYLCHYARTHPSEVDLRALEDNPLWDVIRKNTPFYFHFDQKDFWDASPRRRKSAPPRLTYLTTATLIVVPASLQTQWYSEILKHCSSSIRTLVLKSRKDIPPPLTLASDYDIVLATYDLISMEAVVSKDLSLLNSGYTCRCPEFASVRVPDCSCQPSANISPLLQIRWKRLVRDEGHNAASKTTGLNHFLRMIDTERRWIVTGTPTTNLLGLNFGSVTEEDAELEEIEHPDASSALHLVSKLYDLESDMQVSNGDDTERVEADLVQEVQYSSPVWNRVDREDLRKLGSMLSDYLGVLPFAAEPESFSRLVVNGLMDEAGPLPGTTRVLEQVMSENMVRHRVADIERHVRLPPLTEELVLLNLEEYGQMTYNVLLSFVVVNAVDSERRDMDYLFHPSKAAALASTIENLSHSLFWRFDENALDYELPDNIHRAENAIVHARERGQPDEDIQLVEQAIRHLRKALEDQQFRDMQHGLEAPYRILHAPGNLKQSWGLVGEPTYTPDASASFLAYPSYALDLRDAILRQPLISESALTEHAALVRARNRALIAYAEARKSRSEKRSDAKGSSEKRRLRGEAEVDRARLDTARRTVTVDPTEKLNELHEEFRKAEERLKAEAMDDGFEHSSPHSPLSLSPTSRRPGTVQPSSVRCQLLRQSPYAQIRVGNSTSSKLNYILEEVRKYSDTEKFLIFSSQPFNLVHISEGLDLMDVKHLLFMKEITSIKGKRSRRDQWLTTFETSETYRVFLMELKYGARGLNIVSASRVIFCEPVWHADVESQAIKVNFCQVLEYISITDAPDLLKRVHRIGQTRPVTVKTLAIRSTFEEYMVQRRRAYKGTGNNKLPGLTEEWGVRNYLQNPIFLETPSNNITELNFPLLQVPVDPDDLMEGGEAAVDAHGVSSMGYRTDAFGERMDDPDRLETPSPKRRKVHFA